MPRKHRLTNDSGRVLLLVDDDADYLEATRVLLESEGHQVLLAHDGSDALAVLGSHAAEVLLLDYFMPGLTGEEVVTELRKTNPDRKSTRLNSSHTSISYAVFCLKKKKLRS